MRYLLFLVAASFLFSFSHAQTKIPLIHSGDVIQQGKVLYDSGKYEEAAQLFLTVPARDTNYVSMLSELALAYIAAKNPEKALEICDLGLKTKSEHRAHLLRSQAIALDNAGKYEESVAAFEKAIAEYPLDYGLIYNLGITQYNHKAYDKAVDCFFRVLAIKPFHGGSHLNLGRIAIGQGRKTHAMLAMGSYLSIYTNDNDRLVLMDKFLSNQLTDEGTIPTFDVSACDKLDQVIRAKIATEENFKSKMPIRSPVVQQYELFIQQLSTLPDNSDDRWLRYYLPFYKGIVAKNHVEAFMYNLLASTKNSDVQKWLKKNEKAFKGFTSDASQLLVSSRESIDAKSLGYNAPVRAWYDNNGNVESLGEKTGDKRRGHWVFFYNNHEKSAEGDYSASGDKIGLWKYYYGTGALKSTEDYNTGEHNYFFESGNKDKKYFIKNQVVDGNVEIYHPTGQLREKSYFKNGERQGKVDVLFPRGTVDVTYNYVDGKLDGEVLSYYENGKLYSRTLYKAGQRNGKYQQYFVNGKLRMEGNYVNDLGDGEWRYYFSNGKLEKVGLFKNDEYSGSWKFYDKNGVLESESFYNDKGAKEGTEVAYQKGKKLFTNTYKDGLLIKKTWYDSAGKVMGDYGNNKGNFNSKVFFTDGHVWSEGELKAGKSHGPWKIYYYTGQIKEENNFADGLTTGKCTSYHKNGKVKSIEHYKDDKLHGYYQEFFPHGQVREEGWYQDGQRQQQWLTYYANGTIETDVYYLNDDCHGTYNDFNTDGKITRRIHYNKGQIVGLDIFNADGKVDAKKRKDGALEIYERFYTDGKVKVRSTLVGGAYNGPMASYYPDGKAMYQYEMMGTRQHGLYELRAIDGTLLISGHYANGQRTGFWKYMSHTGSVDSEGRYFNGKMDSIWVYYHPNGKVLSRGNFANDERDGVTTSFATDGSFLFEKNYEDGSLIAYRANGSWIPYTGDVTISFNYPSGTKAYEEHHEKGALHGTRKSYYPNGKVSEELTYDYGVLHGPNVEYYGNGNPRLKSNYKYGELDGVVTEYNEDGTIKSTTTYILGVQNGKMVLYNKGVKGKEYEFWNGTVK